MRQRTDSGPLGPLWRGLVPVLGAAALAAGCGEPLDEDAAATQSAIIGGSNAPVGAAPWQAHLLYNGAHKCGGSLLAPDWVVTAAHCVYDGSGNLLPWGSFTVVLGDRVTTDTDGFEQSRALAIAPIVNPNYGITDSSVQPHNDNALLKLSSPVTYDNVHTAPIRPAIGQDGTGNALATGWGATVFQFGDPDPMLEEPPNLQQALLPLRSNDTCSAAVAVSSIRTLYPDELCAGNDGAPPNTCGGDSGGPLALQRPSGRYELVGVTSWGVYACGSYSMFSRVSTAHDWIRHYVVDPAQDAAVSVLML
jgi:secreted trypsin-like serine protease